MPLRFEVSNMILSLIPEVFLKKRPNFVNFSTKRLPSKRVHEKNSRSVDLCAQKLLRAAKMLENVPEKSRTKPELGHAGQEHPHLDRAHNLGLQHHTVGVGQAIYALHHIQEHLRAAVRSREMVRGWVQE